MNFYMHKFFGLLIAALLLAATPSIAQLGFGIEGGVNISNPKIKNVDTENYSAYVGYFVGLVPAVKLGKVLLISMPVQFSELGVRDELFNGQYRYRYLQFMPQATIRPVPFVGLDIGAYYGFNVSESVIRDGEKVELGEPLELVEDSDAGLIFGIRLMHKGLYAKFQYQLGLADIQSVSLAENNVINGDFDALRQKNRNWQIGIGYIYYFED